MTESKVPFFSMLTGADVLRHPLNRYLFHTRAGYAEETGKLVDQAAQFGTKTFAVAYQDNDFGKAALRGAEQAIKTHGLQLVAAAPVDVKGNNVGAVVEQLSKASPQAVMVLTAGKSGIDFMAAYRRKDAVAWLYALSVVSSQELVKALGEQSRGIVVSQVVPYPWSAETPVVKEYQDLMKAGGKDKASYSYASLEGFISAKLFAEALRRVGRDLTREKLIATLESMKQADAGGFKVAFSPDSHTGSAFVDTTIIGPNGKFMR